MKLLMMCKSRNRPDRIMEMVNSFEHTIRGDTHLVVCLDDDDPKLKEYNLLGHTKISGERRNITQAFNYMISCFPGYDFYGEVNDDMVFRTDGWDEILEGEIINKGKGWGIAFGNDLIHSGKMVLPTQSVISANIINTLGYFMNPVLKHSYTDDTRRDIGHGINRLFYREDVIIEHKHPCVGKAQRDTNYDWVDSHRYSDKFFYDDWKEKELPKEIEKLKEAMQLCGAA